LQNIPHENFPKCESLKVIYWVYMPYFFFGDRVNNLNCIFKDLVQRTVPFWENKVGPEIKVRVFQHLFANKIDSFFLRLERE